MPAGTNRRDLVVLLYQGEERHAEDRRRLPMRADTRTFTAIDADTKLIPCWLIGPRDAVTAQISSMTSLGV